MNKPFGNPTTSSLSVFFSLLTLSHSVVSCQISISTCPPPPYINIAIFACCPHRACAAWFLRAYLGPASASVASPSLHVHKNSRQGVHYHTT